MPTFLQRNLARELYAAILDRIEAHNYDVFSRQAETSLPTKLKTASKIAARNPRETLTRLCDHNSPKIFIPS